MARWFQKREEELPEKLRGKSEEDLVKAMDDADALRASSTVKDAEIASLKTASEAHTSEVTQLKAKMAELEANQTPRRRSEDNGGAGPTSVFINEDQAFQERTAFLQTQVATSGALAARLTTREAIQNGPDGRTEMRLWDKYANEINSLMAQEHPSRQMDPRSWANAFIYVKGLHFSDIQASRDKKEGAFAETGTSGGGAGLVIDDVKKEDQLTPQEIEIAKKFKMTPEKYLERKKGMKFGPAL